MIKKTPVLMVVDDEPLVLNSLERLFEDDYDVLKAENGHVALKLLETNAVDVLISDQRMPGMTGVELLERAKDSSPTTMRILLTGYADLDAVRAAVNAGEVFRYLTKPWSNAVLRETVKAGLNAARASGAEIALLKTTQAVEKPTGSILILDADTNACSAMQAAIGPGYQIHLAHSLEAATRILETDPHVWLMISEVRVQGEEIAEFLSVLKTVNPALISIAATSIQDATIVIRLINEGQIMRFLGKPIDVPRVQQALAMAQTRHSQLKRSGGIRQRYGVDASATVRALRENQGPQNDPRQPPAPVAANSTRPASPAAPAPRQANAVSAAPDKPASSISLLRRVFSLFSR
jgi:response regulator RpfG family c-di-GMP phosphodiesterase